MEGYCSKGQTPQRAVAAMEEEEEEEAIKHVMGRKFSTYRGEKVCIQDFGGET